MNPSRGTGKSITVERSKFALLVKIVCYVAIQDFVIALIVGFILLVSDSGGVNILFWVLFFGKSILLVLAVSMLYDKFIPVMYTLNPNTIVVSTGSKASQNKRISVHEFRTAEVVYNRINERLGFGNIELSPVDDLRAQKLVLYDIEQPERYVRVINKLIKSQSKYK